MGVYGDLEKSRLSKSREAALRWPVDETEMTLEGRSGVAPTRRAGLSSWNSKKWPRWLVPNCDSKPSAVLPLGVAIMPALLIRMFNFDVWDRKSAAPFRMEAKESRLISITFTGRDESVDNCDATSFPLLVFRAVMKILAPVR